MLDRLLMWLGTWVTTRRVFILLTLGLLTVAIGTAIPRLRTDPSPHNLRAAHGGQDRIQRDVQRRFGTTDGIVLVLFAAPDALTSSSLQHQHSVARKLQAIPGVVGVDGLTVSALPHRAGELAFSQDSPENLDDWDEDEDEADTVGEAQGAKSGDDEPSAFEKNQRLGELALPIIEGDLEHFPRGLFSLAARHDEQGLVTRPVVQGDAVTEAELTVLKQAIDESPLLTGRLVSRDRTVAIVAARLDPNLSGFAETAEVVTRIDAALAEAPPPEGVEMHTGGLPHLRHAIVRKMRSDQSVLIPLTLLVCLVLLWVAFRWWPGVLLPIVAVGITAVILIGVMALTGVEMNIINNVLPTLLIIIGISDSIHLVGRYREETNRGSERDEAGRTTVRAIAVACFLTSLTTAIGFTSLLVASTPMLRRFGVLAGLGVVLAYLVTISFLPAALVSFRAPSMRPREAKTEHVDRLIVVLTRGVLRRPWTVVAGLVVFLGLSAWGASRVGIDMKLLDQFDSHDPEFTATRLLDSKLQGIRPLEVVLESDQVGRFKDPALIAAMDEVASWAEQQPGVLGSSSHGDVLHEVWVLMTGDPKLRQKRFRDEKMVAALAALARQDGRDPLAGQVTRDWKAAKLTIHVGDVGARRSMAIIAELEQKLKQAIEPHADVRVQLTGEAYIGSVGIDAIIRDLFYSLLLASAVVFGILTFLFRSLRLGIASIPPNIVPLVGTLGYMSLRGIQLTPSTVIIFAISIGLAVDGTIHIVARYREEAERELGVKNALMRAARGTGRAIGITSVTLTLGFLVLTFSSFVSVRQFGELIAVTVVFTLIATAVVQPALLLLALPKQRARRAEPGATQEG